MALTVDEALRQVGGYRPWQLAVYWFLGFTAFIPVAWQSLAIVFIGWTPPHHCSEWISGDQESNATLMTTANPETIDSCHIVNDTGSNQTMSCPNGWTFQSEYKTIVTEWDLVCERNYLAELSQMLLNLGSMLGYGFGSTLMDRWGRRNIHVASCMALALLGTGVAFSNSYVMFAVLRAAMGFPGVCARLSASVLMLELFDTSHRVFAAIGVNACWLTLLVMLPLISFFMTNWRYFQLMISLFSAIGGIYIWTVPESPLWLSVNGRYKEAEDALEFMAKMNGVKCARITIKKENYHQVQNKSCDESSLHSNSPAEENDNKEIQECANLEESATLVPLSSAAKEIKTITKTADQHSNTKVDDVEGKIACIQLIKNSKLRRHLFVTGVQWFSVLVLYRGMMLASPSMGSNRFLSFAFSAVVEIPAYACSYIALQRCGRKKPLAISFCLAGLPLVPLLLIPQTTSSGVDLTPVVTVLATLAKFGVTAAFCILVLYTSELFPTNLRCTAYGTASLLGCVGTLLAPFTAYAAKVNMMWVTNLSFGCLGLIGALVTFLLPETANMPLANTLGDIDNMHRPTADTAEPEINQPRDIAV